MQNFLKDNYNINFDDLINIVEFGFKYCFAIFIYLTFYILLKKLYPHNFIFKSVKINECHNLDENDSMIGSIILYSGSDIPNKWLICDGSNLFIDEFVLIKTSILYKLLDSNCIKILNLQILIMIGY